MTPEQIALVETSLAAINADLDEVAKDFYARLFGAEPATAAMFHDDPAAQRQKFTAELEQIVMSIRSHESFIVRARELGARHRSYGVRSRHYRLVGAALLGALESHSLPNWTDEIREAWRLAYNLTAEAMMSGAAKAASAPTRG